MGDDGLDEGMSGRIEHRQPVLARGPAKRLEQLAHTRCLKLAEDSHPFIVCSASKRLYRAQSCMSCCCSRPTRRVFSLSNWL